jgi:hypothetical protein
MNRNVGRRLAVAVALAAWFPADAPAASPFPRLYVSAGERVMSYTDCRRPRPALVQRAPVDDLLETHGTLRRPREAADAGLDPRRFRFARRIYVDHVRFSQTVGATSCFLVPHQRVATFLPERAACSRRLVRAIRRLAPRRQRGRAARYARLRFRRDVVANRRAPDGVAVLRQSRSFTSGGGGATAADILERGALGSTRWRDEPAQVRILLPDGVAVLRAHFPAEKNKPAAVVEAPVVGNLAIFSVDREVGDSRPELAEWLDAAGAVVKQVRMRDERR